jgi:hypothetical protein
MKVKYSQFQVYQQRHPKTVEGVITANFKEVGGVMAYSGPHAIELARKWPVFLKGRDLGRFPVVELIANPTTETLH